MREWLIWVTEIAVLAIDAMALLVIVLGTAEAFVAGARAAFSPASGRQRRDVWLRYSRWLIAGLTFQLAADIIETSFAPTWDDIGRLAAIAAVRTFLNFFLERDIADIRARQQGLPLKD